MIGNMHLIQTKILVYISLSLNNRAYFELCFESDQKKEKFKTFYKDLVRRF